MGVLMVTSAGMQIEQASAEDPIRGDGVLSPIAIMSGRTAIYAALALLAMAAVAFTPARFVDYAIRPRPAKFYPMLCVGTVVLVGSLMLVYLPGIARGKAVPARKFARQDYFHLPDSIF